MVAQPVKTVDYAKRPDGMYAMPLDEYNLRRQEDAQRRGFIGPLEPVTWPVYVDAYNCFNVWMGRKAGKPSIRYEWRIEKQQDASAAVDLYRQTRSGGLARVGAHMAATYKDAYRWARDFALFDHGRIRNRKPAAGKVAGACKHRHARMSKRKGVRYVAPVDVETTTLVEDFSKDDLIHLWHEVVDDLGQELSDDELPRLALDHIRMQEVVITERHYQPESDLVSGRDLNDECDLCGQLSQHCRCSRDRRKALLGEQYLFFKELAKPGQYAAFLKRAKPAFAADQQPVHESGFEWAQGLVEEYFHEQDDPHQRQSMMPSKVAGYARRLQERTCLLESGFFDGIGPGSLQQEVAYLASVVSEEAKTRHEEALQDLSQGEHHRWWSADEIWCGAQAPFPTYE